MIVTGNNVKEMRIILNREAKDLNDWPNYNKLKLNVNKT